MSRRTGRPSTPVLDRELIIEVAYRLLRTEDLADVPLSRLARELGVRAPSLYNHVGGWDDLLNGVRGRVVEQIDVGGFGRLPLREALERWLRSYIRAFATLHPTACAAIAVAPMRSHPAPMSMYEVVCSAMRGDGWPDEMVLPSLVAMESFAIGSALDLRAPALYTAPDDAARWPTYHRLFAAGPANRSDQSVDIGVTALLDALFRRATSPDPGPSGTGLPKETLA